MSARNYHVYGVRLRSPWPLPYPTSRGRALATIVLQRGDRRRFDRLARELNMPATAGRADAALPDGSHFVRWPSLCDILVDGTGRRVWCRFTRAGRQAVHIQLGQSLSFALIHLGLEPLHATTVIVDGAAIALLGDNGFGKSTLAAAFVKAGHALLTDDLLVLERKGGTFLAYPGVPRIKLFNKTAAAIFGRRVPALRLGRATPKLIVPLSGAQVQQTPVPLRAIYVLQPPWAPKASRIAIRALSASDAGVTLVQNSFNTAVRSPARLKRQLEQMSQVVKLVPVKSLVYPKRLGMLDAAREAIIEDLR